MFKVTKRLPHCDTLFKRYFEPWFEKDDLRGITRPDCYILSAYNGKQIDIDTIQYLNPEWLGKIKDQIDNMILAAKNDFQFITPFNDFSLETLDLIDKYYSEEKVIQLIKESDPLDFANNYLVKVCLFGSMLGELLTRQENYKWLYSYPYFNSIIVHITTGTGVPVYDWAIKKFSSYGIHDGFAAKLHHAIQYIPNANYDGSSVSSY